MNFDVILKNGWVIDGTGGPAYRADVGLLDTMIGDMGRLEGATARRVIDVSNRYVVPGFIDAHVHGDSVLLADPVHLPALKQGVTTYLIGQDGSSFAPGSPSTLECANGSDGSRPPARHRRRNRSDAKDRPPRDGRRGRRPFHWSRLHS